MSDPTELIRAIVRQELATLRLGDLAVVTSIFPHEDENDKHNHHCHVQLRESQLELRNVPIATPHIGMVSPPRVGDLVLLTYIGGDPNRAIVSGRLYSLDAPVPLHAADEWRVEAPLAGQASLAIDKDQSLVFTAGKTVITVKKDDVIQIQGETDLKIEVKGNVELKCGDCKIDASGNIDLGTGGAGVITEASHKCYFTGKALVPSKTVKAKG